MQRRSMCVVMVWVAAFLASSAGCNRSGNQSENMKRFGLSYATYVDVNRKAPTDWDDLLTFLREERSGFPQPENLTAVEQLQTDGCVAHWGVDWGKGFSHAKYVLLYPPSTATNGGPALMIDGGVQELTADQLKEILEEMAPFLKAEK